MTIIKVEFTKDQADFIARMMKSHLDQTELIKFDPTVMLIRYDMKTCLAILKAAGASEK